MTADPSLNNITTKIPAYRGGCGGALARRPVRCRRFQSVQHVCLGGATKGFRW